MKHLKASITQNLIYEESEQIAFVWTIWKTVELVSLDFPQVRPLRFGVILSVKPEMSIENLKLYTLEDFRRDN
jgi:hypothetical protein